MFKIRRLQFKGDLAMIVIEHRGKDNSLSLLFPTENCKRRVPKEKRLWRLSQQTKDIPLVGLLSEQHIEKEYGLAISYSSINNRATNAVVL